MSWNSRIKLEKRPDNEPRYDPNNKTDRKIIRWVIISSVSLTLLAGVLIACYLLFFR